MPRRAQILGGQHIEGCPALTVVQGVCQGVLDHEVLGRLGVVEEMPLDLGIKGV